MATMRTISGNARDFADGDLSQLVGWIEATVEVYNDADTNTQFIGATPIQFSADGSFEVQVPQGPTGYRVVIQSTDATLVPVPRATDFFEVTGDVELGSATFIQVEQVTEGLAGTVAQYAADAEAAKEAAEAVGATSDAQVANNVNTGPLTGAALDETTASKINDDESATRVAADAYYGAFDSVLSHGGVVDINNADAIIAAAIAAATPRNRKVMLPAAGSSVGVRTVYKISARHTIPSGVVFEGESNFVTIQCQNSTAGIDVGDGTNIPYKAEINNLLIDANGVAPNPLVFKKVSEVYARRVWVDDVPAGGQAIKLHDCLGVTLENPTLSNSPVGIRFTGTSAGYVVIRDHNFWELTDGLRFETGAGIVSVSEGWTEHVRNSVTFALSAFASFGFITFDNSKFVDTATTNRLFYVESATAGWSMQGLNFDRCRVTFASSTANLFDTTAAANAAGTTRFFLLNTAVDLNASGTFYAKHASQGASLIEFFVTNPDPLVATRLPAAATARVFSDTIGLGQRRFATGLSLNSDITKFEGHMRWSASTKRLQIDVANAGTYVNMPIYLSATATLDFPSIAAAGQQELTVTVTGAAVGDVVLLGPPSSLTAGLTWCGYVSAANTVTIRLTNVTAGAIDPASATWRATVVQ